MSKMFASLMGIQPLPDSIAQRMVADAARAHRVAAEIAWLTGEDIDAICARICERAAQFPACTQPNAWFNIAEEEHRKAAGR